MDAIRLRRKVKLDALGIVYRGLVGNGLQLLRPVFCLDKRSLMNILTGRKHEK